MLDPDIALYAPDLIAPEFGNILWKKVRREEIEREEAGEIMNRSRQAKSAKRRARNSPRR